MAYIGSQPSDLNSGAKPRNDFTGDGTTTAFTLSQSVPGGFESNVIVIVDNVIQQPIEAYTIGGSNYTTLQFTEAPASGAVVYVLHQGNATNFIAPSTGSVGASALADNLRNFTVDSFTGNGSTTAFTLTDTPVSVNSILVIVDGIIQAKTTNYTLATNVLTFTGAPDNGSVITVIHLGFSTVSRTGVVDGSITTAKIADNAITSDKIAPGTVIASDIADGTVTTAKIADANITTAKIADGGVTYAKLASDVQRTGMRNRIINGAMTVSQYNGASAVTPSAVNTNNYIIDRFAYYSNQASKFTFQQLGATPPAGFTNYLGCTVASAYSVVSTDRFSIDQAIEVANFYDLGFGTASAKPVTISFWVQSSLTGTFGGSLVNYAGNRSYPFTYSISVANTWTQIAITIPGDTTGTWTGAINAGAAYLFFGLGMGSTYAAAAGSWQAGTFLSATGTVNVVGTLGATFNITGIQLEAGSTATNFEYRQYQQELTLCQRYYESAYYYFRNSSAGYQYRSVPWKVTKRAVPTVTYTVAYINNMTNYGASGSTVETYVVNPYANSTDNEIQETIYGTAEL